MKIFVNAAQAQKTYLNILLTDTKKHMFSVVFWSRLFACVLIAVNVEYMVKS